MMAALKYFAHGLLFSAVYFGIGITGLDFVFRTAMTAALGFFMFGLINSVITRYLWGIPMKSDYWSILEQGLILIWPLGIINLVFILFSYPYLDNWLTLVLVSLVQCMPYGFVCKYIAGRYEDEDDEEETVDISKLDKYN
jgi:hypothetical protein